MRLCKIEIVLQQIDDFTCNQQIDHSTIKTLIGHCSNINNSKSFIEVKKLYKYKFAQKDDELYKNFNMEGFGMVKNVYLLTPV